MIQMAVHYGQCKGFHKKQMHLQALMKQFLQKVPRFYIPKADRYFVYEKSNIDLPLNSLGTSSRRSKNLSFVADRLPKFFVL